MPVVEGTQAGQAQLRVGGPGVDGTAEARDERGETERSPDPGPIHVGDALVDVEAPGAHLIESSRLHAPLGLGAADHGVEPDIGVATALEDPALGAVGLLHDPGCPTGQGGGQAAVEEIGRLDQMVVHRDDGHRDGPRVGVGEQCRRSLGAAGLHKGITLS